MRYQRGGRPAASGERGPPTQRGAHRYGSERDAAGSASEGPIEEFIDLLLIGPAHVFQATEDVVVDGDDLRTTVTLDISTDSSQWPNVHRSAKIRLIPLLNRKQTVDDLQVSAAHGDVGVLTPLETQGLLYLVVKLLFRMALGPGTDPGVELPDVYERALYQLIRLVCQQGRLDDVVFERAYAAATEDIVFTNGTRMRAICRFLARHYITIVEAPARDDGNVRIQYCSTLPPYERMRTWNDKIRTTVGLRPYRFLIPLYWPFFARDYRLNICGPNGQFIYQHYVRNVEDGRRLKAEDLDLIGESTPHLDLQVNAALPRTSLYMRDFHLAKPKELTCVVEFEEIPPGALGRSVAISAVCTMLVAAFALALPHHTDKGTVSDLAALLLASPLFAATWVGQSAERVQQSSLTTYGGLAASGLT